MNEHVALESYTGNIEDWQGDAVVLLLREGEAAPEPFTGLVKELADRRDFTGRRDSKIRVPVFNHDKGVRNIYIAGLGKGKYCNTERVRNVLALALRTAGRQHNRSALVLIGHLADMFGMNTCPASLSSAEVLGEAVGLCAYDFDKYKGKPGTDSFNNFQFNNGEIDSGFSLRTVFAPNLDITDAARGQIYAEAQVLARDWDNEPGCVVNPPVMADVAQSVAKDCGLECDVWDEKRLEAGNMGALLAVGSGSKTPPRLVHLTWRPKENGAKLKKIALVGKGITFDSGGLDLKTGRFIRNMKGDKAGACNVLAVMRAAATLNLPVEIHGILPLAENMPSGSAFRPDDIVRARNGKTIEIENTDAEGRVMMADALCLASELKPDVMIDIATLTGACAIALGEWRAGVFTKDDELADALMVASQRRGEEFWRMPHDDVHHEVDLHSPVADVINSGPRYGGATFATMFLAEFVDENIPWAHIDIAGCDFVRAEWGIYSKGASAFCVRTLLDYLSAL